MQYCSIYCVGVRIHNNNFWRIFTRWSGPETTISTNICIQEFLLVIKMKISNKRWRIHRSWNADYSVRMILLVLFTMHMIRRLDCDVSLIKVYQCVDCGLSWQCWAHCWSSHLSQPSVSRHVSCHWDVSQAPSVNIASSCDHTNSVRINWAVIGNNVRSGDRMITSLPSVVWDARREGKIKFHFSPFMWLARPVRLKFFDPENFSYQHLVEISES